jgi:hypothetical protein
MNGKQIVEIYESIAIAQAAGFASLAVIAELLTETAKLQDDPPKFLRVLFERSMDRVDKLSAENEGKMLGMAREHVSGTFAWADLAISNRSDQGPGAG